MAGDEGRDVVPVPDLWQAPEYRDVIEGTVLDGPGTRRRGSRARYVVAAAILLMLAGLAWAGTTVAGWLPDGRNDRPPEATVSPTPGATGPAAEVAAAFLAAWDEGDYDRMQGLVADQRDDVAGALRRTDERLQVTDVAIRPGTWDPETRALPFEITLTLDPWGPVSWPSTVYATDRGPTDGEAKVLFTASTVYPGMQSGQWLDLRTEPAEVPVLDAAGGPLGPGGSLRSLLGPLSDAGAPDAEAQGSARVVVAWATSQEETSTVAELAGPDIPPVVTTVDPKVQAAAEQALRQYADDRLAAADFAAVPAGLVAVRASTGEVLAVATSGLDAADMLAGTYAPGSTFKIVTAAALLAAGHTAGEAVDCPDRAFAGRWIGNSESVTPGSTTLAGAFADSCNTAFVQQSATLPGGALEETAVAFGFDGSSPLPIRNYSGSIAPAGSPEALAEASIGQGTVIASPLHMAVVAAAVADGTRHRPRILPCESDCWEVPVPQAGQLRDMMRLAVTDGTATGLAGVPGDPVHGKTGTAERGGGGTDGWFSGYQGDVAFTAFVPGGSGPGEAVPLAGLFLAALAG